MKRDSGLSGFRSASSQDSREISFRQTSGIFSRVMHTSPCNRAKQSSVRVSLQVNPSPGRCLPGACCHSNASNASKRTVSPSETTSLHLNYSQGCFLRHAALSSLEAPPPVLMSLCRLVLWRPHHPLRDPLKPLVSRRADNLHLGHQLLWIIRN